MKVPFGKCAPKLFDSSSGVRARRNDDELLRTLEDDERRLRFSSFTNDAALDGTSPDNDEWIRRKSNVVDRFGHSSFYVGTLCRLQGGTIAPCVIDVQGSWLVVT